MSVSQSAVRVLALARLLDLGGRYDEDILASERFILEGLERDGLARHREAEWVTVPGYRAVLAPGMWTATDKGAELVLDVLRRSLAE